MTEDTKSILLNKEVIAIDQDKAGHQGDRAMSEGPLDVWTKPLADGSKAIAIFNRWTMPLTLDVPLAKLGLRDAPVSLHDLWEHKDLPAARGTYHAEVPPHGVVMLRATQR
jgi:alpha-galactosidase